MTTRFTVTDHANYTSAVGSLPNAMSILAAAISAATTPISRFRENPHDGPAEALVALAAWRRRQQAQVQRAENEVLLLLLAAGASERALADAIGISRASLANRLASAAIERDGGQ